MNLTNRYFDLLARLTEIHPVQRRIQADITENKTNPIIGFDVNKMEGLNKVYLGEIKKIVGELNTMLITVHV